jgi:hypothetical protein
MKSSQAVHAHHAARQPVTQPKPRRRATVAAVTPEVREIMIAEAAYYIAERRGFEPGAELDDWLAAEAEIDRNLADGGTVEDVADELDEMAAIAERLAG